MSAKEKILLITGASSDVGIALLPEIYSRYEYLYLQYRTMNDSLKRLIEDIGAEGKVVGMCAIDKELHDVMLISIDGTVIRIDTAGISQMGRSTSGVKVMRLDEDVKIATFARIDSDTEEDDEEEN